MKTNDSKSRKVTKHIQCIRKLVTQISTFALAKWTPRNNIQPALIQSVSTITNAHRFDFKRISHLDLTKLLVKIRLHAIDITNQIKYSLLSARN